jgi:hypothetical protein
MDNEQLHKGMRKANTLWGALLGSMVIYLAVPALISDAVRAPALEALGKQLDYVLYAVGAASLLGAGGVRRALLTMHAGAPPSAVDIDRAAASRYVTIVVLSFAICDSVAILGLVYYLLGGNTDVLFTLTAAAAAAMLLYRPRTEELRRLVNTMASRR